MVALISPFTQSLVQLKIICVPMYPVATCAVSMVNVMQQLDSTEKEARMFRWPRTDRFLSQVPHPCSTASHKSTRLPCMA